MNGLRKKIQILTLSVITAMALMPQFVSAESNNTTQSGIGSISGYDKNKSETGYDYVYLGDYDDSNDGIDNSEPVRWRVLSMRGNGGRYSDESGRGPKSKALFLLSENALAPKTMFKDVETGKTSEKKTPAALVFSLKKSGKGKVLVKWKKLRDAEKYQISVRKGKKGGFKIKGSYGANKSSYVIKKLKKGRKYKFRMRYSYMDNGKRSWSGWTSVKTIKAR